MAALRLLDAAAACVIPVVPHKAVAEVSEYRNPVGEVGGCESWMAKRSH